MEQIELRVPKSIELLVDDERERLLRPALRAVAKKRARELGKEQREALVHIRRFERKYGVSLSEFERKKSRATDTVQAHEDYNDWFFWSSVHDRAKQATTALKRMETIE